MLILFSKKSGGAGPSYTRIGAAYAEQLYSILSSATVFSDQYYTIVNDRINASWSEQTYNLIQTTTVTTFSEQEYNILYDAIAYAEETYVIASLPQYWSAEKYYIIVNKLDAIYSYEKYHLATVGTNYAEEYYTITDDRIPASFSEQSYDISYVSSISSTFETLGDFETEHISEYSILDYDNIEIEHESLYALTSYGVLGISERVSGTWNSWLTVYTELPIHLHLYNTFSSELSTAYNRYFIIHSDKQVHVERVLHSSERSTLLEYYTEYSANRTSATNAYELHYSNTSTGYEVYETLVSERSTICSQVLTLNSDRTSVTRAIYNDSRIILFRKWYESERWSGTTYAKEKDVYVDQRYSWAQISEECFESIRLVGLEVCAMSYDVVINPIYTTYDVTIGTTEVPLFENEKVVDVVNTFTNIPLEVDTTSNEIIIVNDTEEDEPIYTSGESLANITFERIEGTDTYVYRGSIITIKETTFIKTDLLVESIEIYETSEEYIEYLQRRAYLKIEIAGKEMSENSATVVDVPAFTKIPIVIHAHKSVLEANNVNLSLKWTYPYKYLTVNEILLIGIYNS